MAKKTAVKSKARTVASRAVGDPDLGPLKLLPGTWRNKPNLLGRGFNMIALPFGSPGANDDENYRLLLNQYNEELTFTLVDKKVPNRGLDGSEATDQFVVALNYEQQIRQIATADQELSGPASGLAGGPNLKIHHEVGQWLYMTNQVPAIGSARHIGRLAVIPHGDSVLALGFSSESPGEPSIPFIDGLPIGVGTTLEEADEIGNAYLFPYNLFNHNPFKKGMVPGFPGFNPVRPHEILEFENRGVRITRTTTLEVDTRNDTGGITNIPFIVKQANVTSVKSTFWIQELAERDRLGNPKLRLQYLQVVILEFFRRRDGLPGLIPWPHVSINTLEKVV